MPRSRCLATLLALALPACGGTKPVTPDTTAAPPAPPAEASPPAAAPLPEVPDPYVARRRRMVDEDIAARGIADPRVLAVMREVPRHRFVHEREVDQAYEDHPLPIGHGQTISQPYIVAFMTEVVRPQPGDRALDIGTGSGYQAAVLARLTQQVTSLEILCPLADEARTRLTALGYANVEVRCADGWKGAPDVAPFDVIVVAAAPDKVPPELVRQLAPGGRMVIPVGPEGYAGQTLLAIEKAADGTVSTRRVLAVRFVPMTGGEEP
jgi:protein-L-isoaspartate(D-aspartate) O-methyltransferase